MIVYEQGSYGFRVLFGKAGSVFPKAALWAVPSGLLAGLLNVILMYLYLDRPVKETPSGDKAPVLAQSIFVILGLLTVFRNNQAYARFWEGAQLICMVRGEWTNAVTSIMSFCSSDGDKQKEVMKFQHLLVRLTSMLYCCALCQISDAESSAFEIIDNSEIDAEALDFLVGCPDKVEIVMLWIQKLIVEGQSSGVIAIAPPILSRAFQELSRGSVHLNNVRKIKDIPFPFPYAQMQMLLLVLAAIATPAYCAVYTASPLHASVSSFATIFMYMGIFYIGMELEQPFGVDSNDLPIADYQKDLNKSLRTMMHPISQRVPSFVLSTETELCKFVSPGAGVFRSARRVSNFHPKRTTRKEPFVDKGERTLVSKSHVDTKAVAKRSDRELDARRAFDHDTNIQRTCQRNKQELRAGESFSPHSDLVDLSTERVERPAADFQLYSGKGTDVNPEAPPPLGTLPNFLPHLESSTGELLNCIIEELRLLRLEFNGSITL